MKRVHFGLLAGAIVLGTADLLAIEIAKDGKASAVIVEGEKPSPATATAAKELAKYLKQITGAEFEVVARASPNQSRIVVGTSYTSQRFEEICVRVKDSQTLEVTGEGSRGTIYGVYKLLEHFGVGFWAPDNETVPCAKTLSLPDDFHLVDAPYFEYRQPYGESSHKPGWNVKVQINGDTWAMKIPPELGGSYSIDLSQSMAGMNGKEYFKDHPEWFAWREKEKKRSPNQICTHNEDAMKEVLNRTREMMKKDPDRPFVSVSMGDNDAICQCEKCKAIVAKEGTPSALVVEAGNKIARGIASEYPRLRIMIIAYWYTERPPETLTLEPNVAVCFAMLDRDHSKPPSATPRHDRYLAQWDKLSHGKVFIWGYNAQFRNFLLPTPTLDLLGPEFRGYKPFGVRGIFSQLPWGTLSDFVDLRCWLFAKLAWNPDQDEFELINKWCDGACGKGAPYMKEYLQMLKTIRSGLKGYGAYHADCRGIFTPDDLLKGDALFKKAIEATKDDPRTSAQVRQQYASILTALLTRYNFDIAEAAAKKGVKLPSRDKMLDELEALGKEFKCSTYREWDSFDNLVKALRQGEVLH